MKSSFSRSFYTGALILLVSLVMVGVSYQQLVKDYLTDTTFSRLERDAESISHLAAGSEFISESECGYQPFRVGYHRV